MARRGVYRGIPLSNFAGWFATGLAVMERSKWFSLPTMTQPPAGLVGEYVYMGVMETVGFARTSATRSSRSSGTRHVRRSQPPHSPGTRRAWQASGPAAFENSGA